MTSSERIKEVRELIAATVENNGVVAKRWLVQEILGRHTAIVGVDSDWYRCCAYDAVDRDVREVLRVMKRAEDEGDVRQEELFGYGFQKLQRSYVISRHSESVVVALENMTNGEIEAKAEEHDRAARGHELHAQELRRFALERFAVERAG